MKNKAIVILDKNGNTEIQERDMPQPEEDQELLHVKACGICQSDIARFSKGGAHVYPLVIGHEFAGVSNGKRYSVFPLIPCNECDACKSRRFAQCEKYSYYGSRQDGGMQEYIAINKWNLIDGGELSYEQLATSEPCSVANNITTRLDNVDHRTILLNGCGFISLVTAQILAWRGAKIYFRNRNKTKLEFAEKKFGFQPWQEGDKFDTAIDFVFNTESMDFILNHISSFGKVICVGNPQGDVSLSKQACHLILAKELKVSGIWNSIYDDWETTINLMKWRVIDVEPLITNIYDFKDYKQAFENILENQRNPKSLIIKSMLFSNA